MDPLRATARIIVRYRIAFALVAVFLLVLSLYGIQNLRFESGLRGGMLPENHPAIDDYTALQNEFQGGGDSTLIMVKVSSIEPGGAFTTSVTQGGSSGRFTISSRGSGRGRT